MAAAALGLRALPLCPVCSKAPVQRCHSRVLVCTLDAVEHLPVFRVCAVHGRVLPKNKPAAKHQQVWPAAPLPGSPGLPECLQHQRAVAGESLSLPWGPQKLCSRSLPCWSCCLPAEASPSLNPSPPCTTGTWCICCNPDLMQQERDHSWSCPGAHPCLSLP